MDFLLPLGMAALLIQHCARLPHLLRGHRCSPFLLRPVPALYGCFTIPGNMALSRLPKPRRFFLLSVLHPIFALRSRLVCPHLRGLHWLRRLAQALFFYVCFTSNGSCSYCSGYNYSVCTWQFTVSHTQNYESAPDPPEVEPEMEGDGLLTGALRRSRSVRCRCCHFKPNPRPCRSCCLFNTLSERRDTLRGCQVTWPGWCGYDVGPDGTSRWDDDKSTDKDCRR